MFLEFTTTLVIRGGSGKQKIDKDWLTINLIEPYSSCIKNSGLCSAFGKEFVLFREEFNDYTLI